MQREISSEERQQKRRWHKEIHDRNKILFQDLRLFSVIEAESRCYKNSMTIAMKFKRNGWHSGYLDFMTSAHGDGHTMRKLIDLAYIYTTVPFISRK